MKRALFYTFLFVFASTAIVTILGLINVFDIDREYLNKLFYALVVEAIAPVIALFRKTEFFAGTADNPRELKKNRLNVVLLPKESFGRSGDPHDCKIAIYNKESDEQREVDIVPKRENGYLCAYLDGIEEEELIRVNVVNSKNEKWESQFFSPNIAKAEMEKI
jgi:hypothetical protein